MATIKPIDGRSVHQIQSGQVIVDLCSVVKELVENSIDSDATIIDVRLKNQGLDLIEVQDNGSGISPANYDSIALKHHTSKLSSYSDIASLQTFGFRGEALASLCALSNLVITTCMAGDAPKGSRLNFEPSGRLKSTGVVAAQRGTTVSVEKLFHNLPVRRRELERHIKREWQKVIALLNQYACIQTGLKFSVSQQPTKGKRILLFSTKGNTTTRDNIINIFGAKAMMALVSLDLDLEMQPSTAAPAARACGAHDSDAASNRVRIVGHVSRPIHGDGRQTPDRQMFFINGRPCGLPQFAKTFNEVYRSYNYLQSPFIFADIQLDTHMYDVNVSPDKRSILLHDQSQLLDTLRASLVALFDSHDYTVPVSRPPAAQQQSTDKAAVRDKPPTGADITAQMTKFRNVTRAGAEPGDPRGSVGLSSSDHSSGEDSSDEELSGQDPKPVSHMPHRGRGHNHNSISRWLKKGQQQEQGQQQSSMSSIIESTSAQALMDTAGASEDSASTQSDVSEDSGEQHSTSEASDSKSRVALHSLSGVATEQGTSTTTGRDFEVTPEVSSPIHGCNVPQSKISALQPPVSYHARSHRSSQPQQTLGRPIVESATVTIGNTTSLRVSESPRETTRNDVVKFDEGRTPSSQARHIGYSSNHDTDESGTQATNTKYQDDTAPDVAYSSSTSTSPKPDNAVENDKVVDTHVPVATWTGSQAIQAPSPTSHDSSSEHSRFTETNQARGESPENRNSAATADPLAQAFFSGARKKLTTAQHLHDIHVTGEWIESLMKYWEGAVPRHSTKTSEIVRIEDMDGPDAESKLPLIISRSDFATMRVAGQFNMGFIIAVRPARPGSNAQSPRHDELFIIDQHASDEKYNFERLQETTVVQSQRVVHPKRLQLTALEEEIVIGNMTAIEANGFKIFVDDTGDWPVGSRCELLALPLSRETTFSLKDLEELISLLGEESTESTRIPRPSKVRKMFAMRACRSSVMIGKALASGQMYALVKHMGELDKPWNCPHGRPTMRHLCRLQAWDDNAWSGDADHGSAASWRSYVQQN